METTNQFYASVSRCCINCTLRNGNDTKINTSVKKFAVLIVPCGMETKYYSTTVFAADFIYNYVIVLLPSLQYNRVRS